MSLLQWRGTRLDFVHYLKENDEKNDEDEGTNDRQNDDQRIREIHIRWRAF